MASKKLPQELERHFRAANPRVKKFVAKAGNLRLTIVGDNEESDKYGRLIIKKGRFIQFVDGKYSTSDNDEIEFLREHPGFNTPGAKTGFTEIDASINAPDPAELLATVSQLAIDGDLKTLKLIYERESETWNRAAVLASAGPAISTLEERERQRKIDQVAKAREAKQAKSGEQTEGEETPAQTENEDADGGPEKEVAVAVGGDHA